MAIGLGDLQKKKIKKEQAQKEKIKTTKKETHLSSKPLRPWHHLHENKEITRTAMAQKAVKAAHEIKEQTFQSFSQENKQTSNLEQKKLTSSMENRNYREAATPFIRPAGLKELLLAIFNI